MTHDPHQARPTPQQFDESFRRQAVDMINSTGKPLTQVARELGLSKWTLRNWRAKLQGPGQGSVPPREAAAGAAAVGAAGGEGVGRRRRGRLARSAGGAAPLPGSRTVAELEAEIRLLRRELGQACLQRDLLKKVLPLLSETPTSAMRP